MQQKIRLTLTRYLCVFIHKDQIGNHSDSNLGMVFELQEGYTNLSTLHISKITLQSQLKALPYLHGPKYRARARDVRIDVLIPAQRTRAVAHKSALLSVTSIPNSMSRMGREREGNFAAIFR